MESKKNIDDSFVSLNRLKIRKEGVLSTKIIMQDTVTPLQLFQSIEQSANSSVTLSNESEVHHGDIACDLNCINPTIINVSKGSKLLSDLTLSNSD